MGINDDGYRARQLELGRAELESALRHIVAAERSAGGRRDSIHNVANLARLGIEEALAAWDCPSPPTATERR